MSETRPQPNWKNPVHLLAFGLGSGAAPKAPGTAGTLAVIPLYLLISGLPSWGYMGIVLLMFVAGIWICERTSKDLGVHDHSGIVWDEWVGFLLALCSAPPGWWWILVAFVLFRFFDIVKPWPINLLDEKVGGGLGIMLDDMLAGVYAFAFLHLAARLLG